MLSEDFKVDPKIQTISLAIERVRRALVISEAIAYEHPGLYTQTGKSLTPKYSVSGNLDIIQSSVSRTSITSSPSAPSTTSTPAATE